MGEENRARELEAVVRGIKFYNGIQELRTFVHVGFSREITNSYTTKSVLVHIKKSNEILGHLERTIAAPIADIMDEKFPELIIKGSVSVCMGDVFLSIYLILKLQDLYFRKSFQLSLIMKKATGDTNTEQQIYFSVYVHIPHTCPL